MGASFRVIPEMCFQEIGKEKEFQNYKQDEKLDQYDQANLFPPAGKICKSI